jgi:hypothetical protein
VRFNWFFFFFLDFGEAKTQSEVCSCGNRITERNRRCETLGKGSKKVKLVFIDC